MIHNIYGGYSWCILCLGTGVDSLKKGWINTINQSVVGSSKVNQTLMFAIYFPTLLYPPGYWGSQSWDLVIFWSEKKPEIFEDQYFNLKIKPQQSGVRETYLQMHKIWKHQGMQWQVTNGICSKILLNLIKSYQEIDKAFTLS